MRRSFFTLLAITLLALSIPLAAVAEPPQQRVIVVLDEDAPAPAQVAVDLARRHGGTLGFVYSNALKGFSMMVPAAALAGLAANPQVAYVEADVEVFTTGTQPIPTGIDRIEADQNAPASSLSNVDIAIIDTGVYIGHPDYNLRFVTDCTSAMFYPLFGGCSAQGNPNDQNGHGSHVAGITAAYDNDIGTIGTAPGAVLWSLKALNADGSGYLGSILAAIDTVAANSASIEVVNMSFGFAGSAQSLDDALTNAIGRGVVFVAAAGNSAVDATGFSPASHPDVITVSALADFDGLPGGLGAPTCRSDVDDTLADFSNFGAPVDLAAPGVCIYSTYLNDGYATLSGTSMATPFVTGAVARLIAQGYPKPANRAQVQALKEALISGGLTQAGACGFTGDNDGLAEPLLFLNSTLFGGDGTCGGVSEPPGNSPPAASFTHACTDLSCTFSDTSTDPDGAGDIVSWNWSFGDGATSTDQNPGHVYATGGSYLVTLEVTDGAGAQSQSSLTVSVSAATPNQPPQASFTASCSDLTCTFNNTSTDPDLDPLSFVWNFGDGATSTATNPTHSYQGSGTYTVVLTADDGAAVDSETHSVSVTAPPAGDMTFTAAAYPVLVEGRTASVTIEVLDSDGNSIPGATVEGAWTYLDRRGRTRTASETGVTGSNGTVTFGESFPPGSTVESFCVSNVTKAGYQYVATVPCAWPLE